MGKADATVEDLVGKIERGELRLPEMQRRYVWQATRVRDLLDSLYRGYPSGAILLWETDEEVPEREFAVEQHGNPYRMTQLLLDGQQRLTSLSAVIQGRPVSVRGRKQPIEILFNLNHPENLEVVTEVHEDRPDEEEDNERTEDEADSTDDELQQRFNRMTFVVATKKLEQLPQWVRVSDVFKDNSDRKFLRRAKVVDFDDPRGEVYSQRLARLRGIRKYTYRLDVLERSLSYDEVTEIFVRVNSLGAKLRGSDLALAQITAKWRGSLETFERFRTDCQRDGFDLDLGVHLRNLVVFATRQSRFTRVANLSRAILQKAWTDCVPGMEFAINFVKNNAELESHALLSSPYVLLTVAYYGHVRQYEISSTEARMLRQWTLTANAKGRYSRGSSESTLDQDLTTLRQGGGPVELLERVRTQVGQLDIQAEELQGRSQLSALFKTMFPAFKAAGARDWRTHLTIALGHRGQQHRMQYHHIFPKALLKNQYTQREIDDIANLAFIGGKTNRQISNKLPKEYFSEIIKNGGLSALEAQCIPTTETLLDIDAYRKFLTERRKLIARRLNEFLATSTTIQ